MTFDHISSIRELNDEPLFSVLLDGIPPDLQDNFRKLLTLTVTDYAHLFDDECFITKRYQTENVPEGYNTLQYILPTLKRVFVKFYVKTPDIFENFYFRNKRELFQLQFNLKEFLEFLSDKYKKNWNCLQDFENLDSVTEVLTLIVQDYISSKVNVVQSTPQNEITSRIRQIKIEQINP